MQHNTTQHTQTYIKLEITETARDCLNDDPHRYSDDIIECFRDMDGLKEFLIDRYERVPNGRNKIYRDTPDGAAEVGFTHSFWNKDWSHNSKSWYQTDWIEITDVIETSRLLHAGGM